MTETLYTLNVETRPGLSVLERDLDGRGYETETEPGFVEASKEGTRIRASRTGAIVATEEGDAGDILERLRRHGYRREGHGAEAADRGQKGYR